MAFSCQLDGGLQVKISTEDRAINLKHLANHIWEYAKHTPLDILALSVDKLALSPEIAKSLFSAYDEFVEIMSNKDIRQQLKEMRPQNSRSDANFQRVRRISLSFEAGLNHLFFKNERMRMLTEKYGVF